MSLPGDPPPHTLSRDLFDALAAGQGGPEATRTLVEAQRSKHTALVRGITLSAARAADTEQARFARHGHEVLVAAQHRDPVAAAQAICYPAVGAWAMRTLRGNTKGAGSGLARLSAVAAAAAIRAGLDVEVAVLADAGTVSLPSLGVVYTDADAVTVRSFPDGAEIYWPGGQVMIPSDSDEKASGWHGLRRPELTGLDLVIDDLDPFRMPAVTGIAPRLSARDAADWQTALQQGYELLACVHQPIAADVAAAVTAVVPIMPSAHGQVSSSSPETFGAIAMSKPPDPYTCAATLAHEVQHLKLCALIDIVWLTRPDDGRRYYAPWRADPRPVAGLLQGAYAYLGVTGYWRAQRACAPDDVQLRADSEFARWRAGTARVIGTLLSTGQLTSEGRKFVEGMSETISAWGREPVPGEARATALEKSQRHLARWELDNGPAPG
jgi:HEXXH motif-containing protein